MHVAVRRQAVLHRELQIGIAVGHVERLAQLRDEILPAGGDRRHVQLDLVGAFDGAIAGRQAVLALGEIRPPLSLRDSDGKRRSHAREAARRGFSPAYPQLAARFLHCESRRKCANYGPFQTVRPK